MPKTPLIAALLLAASLAQAMSLSEAVAAYDEGDRPAAARGFRKSVV